MDIAIIGGGVAGLSAAIDLSRAGHSVTIFEAESTVGGLAAGFKDDSWGWSLEKFYHHWFFTDTDILRLIDEIGQSDKVYFSSPKTSLWVDGENIPLDTPFMGSGLLGRIVNILKLSQIPLFARLRMGAVGFFVSKIPDGTDMERHTANEWSEKWLGKAAHNLIWRPMLIGKFGEYYDQVNMAWLWARLNKRTAKLGTYQGGFQAFLDDLAEYVIDLGVKLNLGVRVEEIKAEADGQYIIVHDGGTLNVDRILSTTSPHLMARLAPSMPEEYRNQLNALTSMSALAMVIALDRQLMEDGTYWLNLPAISPDKDKNPFPFLALVEHTNWLDRSQYNGDYLIYLGDYLSPDHENFTMSDDDLAERYLPTLKKVNPDFSPKWITKRWVFRAPYAQPIPFVGHSEAIPDIRTPLEGVYFASMSQVYPWDRGTNYAVEIGRRAAQMMLDDM